MLSYLAAHVGCMATGAKSREEKLKANVRIEAPVERLAVSGN